MNCPFCEPDHVLYQNGNSRIIVNIFPSQMGHVLVVPIRHIETIGEMSSEEWLKFSLAAKRAADIIGECMTSEMNLILNQGKIAGQTVRHLHFGVIPRWQNDNLVNFSRKQPRRYPISKASIGFLQHIFMEE